MLQHQQIHHTDQKTEQGARILPPHGITKTQRAEFSPPLEGGD